MAGILYFFPSPRRPVFSAAAIPVPAVREVVGDTPVEACQVTAGPERADGYIVVPQACADHGEAPRCRYVPDQQQWHTVRDQDGKHLYSVGWLPSAPPRPADLARGTRYAGHQVTLGGETWTVPVVLAARSSLPQGFALSPSGQIDRAPLPQYAAMEAQALRWFELSLWSADGAVSDETLAEAVPSLAETYSYVCAALGVNYRLGPVECSAAVMCLIKTTDIRGIIDATLDVPSILADIDRKKKGGDVQHAAC